MIKYLKILKRHIKTRIAVSGFYVVFVTLITSCNWFVNEGTGEVVARVNEHYLTKEDIKIKLGDSYPVDSLTAVQGYINEWATKQLFIDGALRNLPAEDRLSFEELVQNYRNDLYIKYYKDALVQKELDSIVSDTEAEKFYATNQNNFLLNEQLVQFRFIQLDEAYSHPDDVIKRLTRFNKEDRYILDSLKFQFKNFFLNDSSWVKAQTVIRQVNVLTPDKANEILKRRSLIQLRDSLGLYLITIKKTLGRGDIAPLSYVRPTINQIIRNRRKVELVRKLEKEIKDDAIKNKRFEVYN